MIAKAILMANVKGQNADVLSYVYANKHIYKYVPKSKNIELKDFNSTNANTTIKFAVPRVASTLYTKH